MKIETKPVTPDRMAMTPVPRMPRLASAVDTLSKKRVRASTWTTSRISTTVMTTGLAKPANTASLG